MMEPGWTMERRRFSREFKFEAVELVREPGGDGGAGPPMMLAFSCFGFMDAVCRRAKRRRRE